MTAFVLQSALASCGIINDDAYIDLGRGYGFVRTNGCEVKLEHGTEVLLAGNAAAYALRGTLVAGSTDLAGYSPATIEEQSLTSGYFIVDTSTGAVRADLREDAWARALEQRGWKSIDLREIGRSCSRTSPTDPAFRTTAP